MSNVLGALLLTWVPRSHSLFASVFMCGATGWLSQIWVLTGSLICTPSFKCCSPSLAGRVPVVEPWFGDWDFTSCCKISLVPTSEYLSDNNPYSSFGAILARDDEKNLWSVPHNVSHTEADDDRILYNLIVVHNQQAKDSEEFTQLWKLGESTIWWRRLQAGNSGNNCCSSPKAVCWHDSFLLRGKWEIDENAFYKV